MVSDQNQLAVRVTSERWDAVTATTWFDSAAMAGMVTIDLPSLTRLSTNVVSALGSTWVKQCVAIGRPPSRGEAMGFALQRRRCRAAIVIRASLLMDSRGAAEPTCFASANGRCCGKLTDQPL